MTDIAIAWDAANARGDWVVQNYALAVAPDIETSVLMRLFTDAPASADYVPPPGSSYRGGCWIDSYVDAPLGSRLWQLDRAVKSDSQTLLAQARDYCTAALADLVTDGVVASIVVTTAWASPTAIAINVFVTAPDGTQTRFDYAWAWNGVFGAPMGDFASGVAADALLIGGAPLLLD